MGLFKGIGSAEVFGSGQYFKAMPNGTEALYLVEILAIKIVESKRKKGRNFFVVETKIQTTTCPDYQPGQRVTWMVDLSLDETAMSNVKGFCLGLDPDFFNDSNGKPLSDAAAEDEVTKLVGADEPAKGIMIKASALTVPKRNGDPFTKVVWTPADQDAAAA